MLSATIKKQYDEHCNILYINQLIIVLEKETHT